MYIQLFLRDTENKSFVLVYNPSLSYYQNFIGFLFHNKTKR